MSTGHPRGPLCRVLSVRTQRVMLRSATQRDVAAVARMQANAALAEHRLVPDIAGRRHDVRNGRRHWRRAVRHPRQHLFVAVRRSELLGAIGVDLIVAGHRWAPVRRRVYLHSLYITPGARRYRVARGLTRLALDWGRDRGATQARLEMAAPNRSARALYESLGFRVREMMFARQL